MTKRSLAVGQKLWYVPSHRGGRAEEVTVTKIGRKWATVGEDWRAFKIDLETWCADGGQYSSPGACYESKEAYDAECRLRESWNKVRDTISRCYRVPEGFTQETVNQLARQFALAEIVEVKQ